MGRVRADRGLGADSVGAATLVRGMATADLTRTPFAEAFLGAPEISSTCFEATARTRRDAVGAVTLAEIGTADAIGGMVTREAVRTRAPSSALSYAYVFRSANRLLRRSAPTCGRVFSESCPRPCRG